MPRYLPAAAIRPGQSINLEGDRFADNGNHPEFEFEYQPVYAIAWEGDSCVVLYCDNFACGFPPGHLIEINDTVIEFTS